MKNTYCPKRGKKGKRSENFMYSFFKEKLKLNAKLFPRGIFNEDILLIINNIDILVEVENKDMKNWSTCYQNFPSNEYINFSSRRKIRKNCFQIVLNNSHTKFLIYSHDIIEGCKEETETNSETGDIYKVRKIPVSLSKEFSVWDFDLEDFYGIINSKENLKMTTKNKPRNNKNHYAARYYWTLERITQKERKSKVLNLGPVVASTWENSKNNNIMDLVSEWAFKVCDLEKLKANKPMTEADMTEADRYIEQKYGFSDIKTFSSIREDIGLSKNTIKDDFLTPHKLLNIAKEKNATFNSVKDFINDIMEPIKEKNSSTLKASANNRKKINSDQQPSSSTSLPDISEEYNSVNVEEKMPSRLSKLKEIINSNISDDLKEELIKKLTQENVN
jgi:hypothetical protein